jgi:hypothetical protein
MLTTCILGTIDLLTEPFCISSWELPANQRTKAYEDHLTNGGSKYEFEGERYELAPATLYVDILASIAASEAALISVWQKDVVLQWAEDSGTVMSCAFEDVDPARFTRTGFTRATLVGKRHLADFPRIEYAAQTVNSWTAVCDFPGSGESAVPGDPDIPARTSLRAFWAQAVTSAFVGLKPDPGASYVHLDDYGATADANAVGGYKLTATNLSGTWAALGTAPDLSTADNRGRHLAFLRASNTGTVAGAVKYRSGSSVTGASIAATTTVYGSQVDSTVANAGGYGVANLGEVQIPAGSVPDVQTGSGYSAEAAVVAQTTGASLFSGSSMDTMDRFGRTFATTSEHITRITPKIKNVSGVAQSTIMNIYEFSTTIGALVASSSVLLSSSLDGTQDYPFDIVLPTGDYAWAILATDGTLEYYFDDDATDHGMVVYGTYTDMEGPHTGWVYNTFQGNPYFTVYGQTSLAFVSKTPAQAMTDETSKTATIDALIRGPLDAGAILWQPSAASTAGQGIYVDNMPRMSSNVYLCDTDGIGPSVIGRCRRFGKLQAWPGVVNRLVAAAYTPVDAVPGNVTYQMSVIGRSARLGSERPK